MAAILSSHSTQYVTRSTDTFHTNANKTDIESGPKASRYTLGNVYIHVMKGERFTPASASKLITGHVTDKPRPCFLTWWGESPEDVIYLAPLPGAIPPVEWQEVGHNSNLHVVSTRRARQPAAIWLASDCAQFLIQFPPRSLSTILGAIAGAL